MVRPALRMLGNISMAVGGHLTRMVMRKLAGCRDDTFGGWFYIDPERGMQTGWVLIDGVWYYFHPVSDGRRGIMYAGQKTPDGYYVDEKGAWDGKEK